MKLGKWTCAVLMGASVAIAAPEQSWAEVYVITIFGQVTDFQDQTAVFGSGGKGTFTVPYKAIHTISIPSSGGNSFTDATGTTYYGGANNGNISPISSSITIKGVTINEPGYNEGLVKTISTTNPKNFDMYSDSNYRGSIKVNNVIWHQFSTFSNQFDDGILLKRINYLFGPSDVARGGFLFRVWDLVTNNYDVYAAGSLVPQQINIKPISAAALPEPSTWALMILGFGGIGAAMRRRASAGRVTARISYSQ